MPFRKRRTFKRRILKAKRRLGGRRIGRSGPRSRLGFTTRSIRYQDATLDMDMTQIDTQGTFHFDTILMPSSTALTIRDVWDQFQVVSITWLVYPLFHVREEIKMTVAWAYDPDGKNHKADFLNIQKANNSHVRVMQDFGTNQIKMKMFPRWSDTLPGAAATLFEHRGSPWFDCGEIQTIVPSVNAFLLTVKRVETSPMPKTLQFGVRTSVTLRLRGIRNGQTYTTVDTPVIHRDGPIDLPKEPLPPVTRKDEVFSLDMREENPVLIDHSFIE